MKMIGMDATPIGVLLVEDSPGDVRRTREAFIQLAGGVGWGRSDGLSRS